jgi:hypothetical protein
VKKLGNKGWKALKTAPPRTGCMGPDLGGEGIADGVALKEAGA